MPQPEDQGLEIVDERVGNGHLHLRTNLGALGGQFVLPLSGQEPATVLAADPQDPIPHVEVLVLLLRALVRQPLECHLNRLALPRLEAILHLDLEPFAHLALLD
ncbi:hypothetical protein D3C72_2312820 [compost metagenome]